MTPAQELALDLTMRQELWEKSMPTTPGLTPANTLLIRHGVFCHATPSHRKFRRGLTQQCFRNSMMLAMTNPDLTYVEGYARHPDVPFMSFHHAWCIDGKGRIVENTWDVLAPAYFGIPMITNYVSFAAIKSERYSVLFNAGFEDVYFDHPQQFVKPMGSLQLMSLDQFTHTHPLAACQ